MKCFQREHKEGRNDFLFFSKGKREREHNKEEKCREEKFIFAQDTKSEVLLETYSENAIGRGDDTIIPIFGNERSRRRSIKKVKATQKSQNRGKKDAREKNEGAVSSGRDGTMDGMEFQALRARNTPAYINLSHNDPVVALTDNIPRTWAPCRSGDEKRGYAVFVHINCRS